MKNSPDDCPVPRLRVRFGGTLVAVLATAASVAAFGSAAAAAAKPASKSEATPCTGALSTTFSPWGDSAQYRLAPDGDFSVTPSAWTLSDGAELVADDSPLSGGTALKLDYRASALSAPICLDGTESFSRVLTRSEGDRRNNHSGVLVEAVAPDGRTFAVGSVQSDDGWDPSGRFSAPRSLTVSGVDSFQYRFTSIGKGTTFIDDLYVDPRARH